MIILKNVVENETVINTDEAEKEAYILNVAKSSSYQNQSEEYYEAFSKWRAKKNNHFGYDYVKDVRENTYVDGKGYVSTGPENAEKNALINCVRLISFMLIAAFSLNFVNYFIVAKLKGIKLYSPVFFAYQTSIEEVPFDVVLTTCALSVLKLLIPVVIFFMFTKMPLSVTFPKAAKKNRLVTVAGISFMMFASIFGRVNDSVLDFAFGKIGIAFSNFSYLNPTDLKSHIVYIVCECLVISVLTEILFRGVILQFFRQFGDLFALIAATIASGLFSGDITSICADTITALIIGIFTLRSGSIFTAFAMRISERLVTYLFIIMASYGNDSKAVLIESLVMLVIICFALIAYSLVIKTKDFDFNIKDSYTHLTLKNKCLHLISARESILFLVIVLITLILSIRFV